LQIFQMVGAVRLADCEAVRLVGANQRVKHDVSLGIRLLRGQLSVYRLLTCHRPDRPAI
jgi:hypothetical protein